MPESIVDFKTVKNLPAMFFEQADIYADKPFLWGKSGSDGAFTSVTWRQAADQVTALARGLRARGIVPGDRVVVVAENRPEWLLADLAIMAAGAITVPTYTTNTVNDHRYILTDCGAAAVIVSTTALAERVLPAAQSCASCSMLISIDDLGASGAALDPAPDASLEILSWGSVYAEGQALPGDVVAWATALARDGLCCLIYTSGTGGRPKGVMLSHRAILTNCFGALQILKKFGVGDEVFLSLLPLSHAYEHTIGLFLPIGIGAEVYYSAGPEALSQELVTVQPTLMTAVPRLYEVLHARIRQGVEREGGRKAALFARAVALGRKAYADPKSLTLGERLMNAFLEVTVRRKVRQRFGGRLRAFVSGGAALNEDIGTFFLALGVRLLQGYGQTEAAPVICVNPPEKIKIHTVGPALDGVDVRLAEDGEILVRGDLLMEGYWGDPEATAATIIDGWLHTGDIGVLDEDGYLEITDRKKDLIVNTGGDNISPMKVEGVLTLQPDIAQAMVYGDKQPYLVAVLVPKETFTPPAAGSAADKELRAVLNQAVAVANGQLSNIEKIRRFIIADSDFNVDNELLTPTLKIRRHRLKELYGERLEALYG